MKLVGMINGCLSRIGQAERPRLDVSCLSARISGRGKTESFEGSAKTDWVATGSHCSWGFDGDFMGTSWGFQGGLHGDFMGISW